VLAQTRLVRKLWFSTLTDAYEDFAKHVEKHRPRAREDDQQPQGRQAWPSGSEVWRFSYAKTIKAVSLALGGSSPAPARSSCPPRA
jgi:hypothetical protein